MRVKNRIVYHLFFWLLAFVFWSWFFTKLTQNYSYTLVLLAIVIPVAAGLVYFFNFYLIPKYLFTKRYCRFTLFAVYALTIGVWLILMSTFLYFTILLQKGSGAGFPFVIDVAFYLAGTFLVIFAGVLSHVIRENFRILVSKTDLEKQQLETQTKLKELEMQLLKNQFQPHFLFNTLNNLYALSLKKSNDTPQLILKLSELLDYSLYGSEKGKVTIREEIEFITNYLDFAKLRFGTQLAISLNQSTVNSERSIHPHLFIPFVENAVKHGITSNPDIDFIQIDISEKSSAIDFNITNSREPNSALKSGGLGLQQAKQRLELLYPERFDLNIREEEKQFMVSLKIYE